MEDYIYFVAENKTTGYIFKLLAVIIDGCHHKSSQINMFVLNLSNYKTLL